MENGPADSYANVYMEEVQTQLIKLCLKCNTKFAQPKPVSVDLGDLQDQDPLSLIARVSETIDSMTSGKDSKLKIKGFDGLIKKLQATQISEEKKAEPIGKKEILEDDLSMSQASHFTSMEGPPKVYEEALQDLEADVRRHIRI